MDITLFHIHLSLMNCVNKVILLRFYNELKFHILFRDGKMLRYHPVSKISILSKSGHSTFVLSTIDKTEYTIFLAHCYTNKTRRQFSQIYRINIIMLKKHPPSRNILRQLKCCCIHMDVYSNISTVFKFMLVKHTTMSNDSTVYSPSETTNQHQVVLFLTYSANKLEHLSTLEIRRLC